MKILWIEDGGANLPQRAVAMELFQGIFSVEAMDEMQFEEELWVALPKFFEEHGVHRIYPCRSYLEWKHAYEEEAGDFDLILVDINLERFGTPKEERPAGFEDVEDFDKRGGLYIYNQLLRDGYPENHIAFFTGEGVTLDNFSLQCQNALMNPPTNRFEKSEKGYKEACQWIKERVKNEYNVLRRGIIDGCQFLANELNMFHDEDLPDLLLFYKTTYENVGLEPELFRDELQEYLNRLESFFPLKEPADKNFRYSRFISEMSREWSQSTGYFVQDYPQATSSLEGFFHVFSQRHMFLLNNWCSEKKLGHPLGEADVAFLFMIAMRSWVYLQFESINDYELMMEPLFNEKIEEGFQENLKYRLDKQLESSLRALAREVEVELETEDAPVFHDYLSAYSAIPNSVKSGFRIAHKKQIQERSIQLIYKGFWHGICPGWLEGRRAKVKTHELYNSNEGNVVRYFAGLSYGAAFGKG